MKSILFFLNLFASVILFSQNNIESYVRESRIEIKSIDPGNNNYDELEAIGKAIGDKRVVMLGEQDHGDAPTFLTKTRLIKYLHEKKGFNILAFESDFFSLNEGWKTIDRDTAVLRKHMQANIFPIWIYCDACDDLFYKYIPDNLGALNPVIVTGFDSQLHGYYSRKKLLPFLDSVLTESVLPVTDITMMKKEIIIWTDSLMKKYGWKFKSSALFDTVDNYLQIIATAWKNKYGNDFTLHVLRSIKSFNLQTKYAIKDDFESINVRDAQMAANLDWLVNEKYRNEKIIVWAHNFHILNKSWDAMGRNVGKHYSMGNEFLKDTLNSRQTYVLGFTSKQGEAGRIFFPGGYKLKKPLTESFENWMGETEYAFIDFTPYSLKNASPEFFYMKGKDHQWNAYAQWTRAFDGIFFIKNMYRCKRIE
jgi:erythromycin esterase-like protein